jgi:hypothetical protein
MKSLWLRGRVVIGSVVTVILVIVVLVIISRGQGASSASGTGDVDPRVLSAVTNVSPDTFAKIGSGGVRDPFISLPNGPVLTSNGKPVIFYVGAEYCPSSTVLFEAPPYTTSQNTGGIPFVDYGNQYITLSSGFSPAYLHEGQDPNGTPLAYQDIASRLSNPNDTVTQQIVGNANYLTAGICKLTNDQPSNVCNTPAIQQLEVQLPTSG